MTRTENLNKILSTVSDYYGISIEVIKGGLKLKDIVEARHAYIIIAYDLKYPLSISKIFTVKEIMWHIDKLKGSYIKAINNRHFYENDINKIKKSLDL